MRKRDKHDLSSYRELSLAAGDLVPINVVECLPNDTFVGNTEAIVRLSSLSAPTMHPLRVKIFHFFCPTRLVWSDWEKFITQGTYGSTPPVHPFITVPEDSLDGDVDLLSYLGAKNPYGGDADINAIPVAIYNKIFNTFFRDQDLVSEVANSTASGDRTGLENIILQKAAWEKGYFGSARPWAQKSPAVPIPQSGIVSSGVEPTFSTDANPTANRNLYHANATDNPVGLTGSTLSPADELFFGNETGLEMDDSATIQDLRISGALQRFFEARAKDGSRLVEYLRSSFGAKVQDSRLQNPELITWGEKTIQFSEVLQTGEGVDPVGTLRGHGVGGMGTNRFKYYIPEHGYIMSLAYIMPRAMYAESMERFWFYNTFTDYYQHEFETVGEQRIYKGEINGTVTGATRTETWGFAKRYDQYRRALDVISGKFMTTDKNWHMARFFGNGVVPTLNSAFVNGNPTTRIFNDEEEIYSYRMMAYHNLVARRNVRRHPRNRIL